MGSLLLKAQELQEEIIADRRWLHRHPEVGFDLPKTTEYVKKRLRDIGCEPEEIISCGLVVTIGDLEGPCFLLRADMDALPLEEETGLPFASKNGMMHACGHDGHTAMMLATTRLIKERESELKGCVKIIFQPDEEGTAPEEITGNEAMINAGALQDPHVDAAFAIHLMTVDCPSGSIVTRKGAFFSSVDDVVVEITGKGCHGSRPHQGVDPINIAAHVFLGIENVLAREIDPAEQCVISFGTINGGTLANIIPEKVTLVGTLRAVSEDVRDHAKRHIVRICEGIAGSFGGKAEVSFLKGVPSVYNDPDLTDELAGYLEELTGRAVRFADQPLSISDDMSVISQKVPTAYCLLGAGSLEEGHPYPLHNPKITFNEDVYAQGAAMSAAAAIRWLETRSKRTVENDSISREGK